MQRPPGYRTMKWETKNTTPSEQFHAKIGKIVETEEKSIPLTHIFLTVHSGISILADETFLLLNKPRIAGAVLMLNGTFTIGWFLISVLVLF